MTLEMCTCWNCDALVPDRYYDPEDTEAGLRTGPQIFCGACRAREMPPTGIEPEINGLENIINNVQPWTMNVTTGRWDAEPDPEMARLIAEEVSQTRDTPETLGETLRRMRDAGRTGPLFRPTQVQTEMIDVPLEDDDPEAEEDYDEDPIDDEP